MIDESWARPDLLPPYWVYVKMAYHLAEEARAGRVDRIGQKAEEILCYSFLPAEGVERLIRMRTRVRQRLQQNAEVVGTDETFFEDEKHDGLIRDLFTEKSGILDDAEENEVDLASFAYQIWKKQTPPSRRPSTIWQMLYLARRLWAQLKIRNQKSEIRNHPGGAHPTYNSSDGATRKHPTVILNALQQMDGR